MASRGQEAGQGRPRRWTRRPEAWAFLALAGALIVTLVGWPYTHHVIGLAGVGAMLLAIPVWVMAGWRAGLAWAVAGAAAFSPIAPQFLPRFSEPASGCHLRVLTFNTLRRIENDSETVDLVREVDPAIIFLQETGDTGVTARAIMSLPGWEGASVADRPERASLIISKFPLWQQPGEWADLRTETRVEGVQIALWNIHGPKDYMGQEDYDIYHAKLFAEIAQTRTARLVAGDFNATDLTPEMRKLLSVMDDAFQTAGWGFGFTFPGPARTMGRIAPFIRIDRVLYSPEFDVTSIGRMPHAYGSDHYPVVADLVLIGRGEAGQPCKP